MDKMILTASLILGANLLINLVLYPLLEWITMGAVEVHSYRKINSFKVAISKLLYPSVITFPIFLLVLIYKIPVTGFERTKAWAKASFQANSPS